MKASMYEPRATRGAFPYSVAARGVIAAALALAGLGAVAQARAVEQPQAVPTDLVVDGHRVFFVSHAFGTQNYLCLPRANGVGNGWAFVGPQATLYDVELEQVTTHYLSVNPDEGVPRAAWQHSKDSSTVWAKAVATSTDPAYVAPGAIPWLKLEVIGDRRGPTSGKGLTRTTFILRLNTTGGRKPATGCSVAEHIGAARFVPYTAEYFFYRED